MSVLEFDAGDKFILQTWKDFSPVPNIVWRNVYEFVANATGLIADLYELAAVLIEFERLLSLSTTHFRRVTISTWTPDSTPYDPTSFADQLFDVAGGAGSTGLGMDLRNTWEVKKQTVVGRNGKLSLRNTYGEASVEAPAGISTFSVPTTQSTNLETAVTDSELASYLGANAELKNLTMAIIGKTGYALAITELSSRGPGFRKMNNKYFDKA